MLFEESRASGSSGFSVFFASSLFAPLACAGGQDSRLSIAFRIAPFVFAPVFAFAPIFPVSGVEILVAHEITSSKPNPRAAQDIPVVARREHRPQSIPGEPLPEGH